jgi:Tfp pilus assembly protein PilP
MTNQNPASSQPLNSDLLAKLNAHADRSLDRLFTDIDELLSGDLEADAKSAPANQSAISPSNYRNEADYRQYDHDRTYAGTATATEDRFSPQLTAELDPPQPAKAKPKKQKRIPVWLVALSSVGAASIAAGGLLYWAVNERKVTLPQNIDTSWVPFQSKPQVSPADAKFAEYMQKSIAKIEATNLAAANAPATAIVAQPNPANASIAPYQAAPIAIATPPANPANQVIATAPVTKKPTLTTSKPIALVKTIQTSGKTSAIFQVDKKDQPIKIGQKIGASNWSLINIAKNEVTIKGKGGEIRSIKIGQKF